MIFAPLMLYSLLLKDSVAFRVELPPAAHVGDPVPVVLRLTNRTERSLTLALQGRPLAFDATVSGSDHAIVCGTVPGDGKAADRHTRGPGHTPDAARIARSPLTPTAR